MSTTTDSDQEQRLSQLTINSPRIKPCNFLIEGTIGAGKSTFLERLKNLPVQSTMIPEPVNIWTNYKGHNYLELFYKDTQKYAFAFQLMVMNTALNAYVEGQKEHAGKLRFFERSLYSPIKTFALKQYNDGVITQPEYDLLEKITYDNANLVDLDIKGIIYIKTSPKVAQSRVIKRSRKEDEAIPIEYLNSLHELHEDWLQKDKNLDLPVLTYINDSTVTLDNFEKVEQAILEWIQEPCNMVLDPSKL